jgi:uncharacterized protein involved in response to NO
MKPNSLPIFSEVNLPAPLPQGWPLLRLGFRPFYIGGALLAAVIVPLWVAIFLGWLPLTPASQPLPWHAHEMLFGVAVAIMVGFLMTAGKVWTGFATPRGPTLAVGATGGFIIGMITRTTRGHTGRLLAVSGPEVLAC